jgi:hypothetical protein
MIRFHDHVPKARRIPILKKYFSHNTLASLAGFKKLA